MKLIRLVIVFVLLLGQACHVTEQKPKIKLGIDVLKEHNFDILRGKRVGVLTSKAGVDSEGYQTWRILKNAPDVEVCAIFAPVHGLDGKFMALETFFNDEIDEIPVYSVYASNSRPKDEWLKNIDTMVVDLQGLGIRFYNYWAFMVYVMAACFEHGIDVVVLDRPNPLGGHYIGGPSMDAKYTSIWGPVEGMPLFHGMTIGELALYCKEISNGITAHQQVETCVIHSGMTVSGETLKKGKLTVVPMEGWTRDMTWEETGLKWIPTSPYIQNLQSAKEYAFLALSFIASPIQGFDNCDFIYFNADLDRSLPMHSFTSKYTLPQNIIQYVHEVLDARGVSGYSLEVDKNHNAINLNVRDIRKTIPGLFGLAILTLSQRYTKLYFYGDDNYNFLGTHIGDNELLEKLAKMERIDIPYFEKKWKESTANFLKESKRFYLYK